MRRGTGVPVLLMVMALSAGAQEPTGTRLRVARDTVLAGVRCGPTGRASAVLHANGRLDECPLAADTIINGHVLPRGTWVRLDDAGRLSGAWLPRDVLVQGLPCHGTGYKGWSVMFHPNGRLRECFPARDLLVFGVPCRGGGRFLRELRGSTMVVLHDDGSLASCRLSRAFTVAGVTHRAGTRLALERLGGRR